MIEELLRVLNEDDTNLEVKVDDQLPRRLIFTNRDRRYVVYHMRGYDSGGEYYYLIDTDGDYVGIKNGSPLYSAVSNALAELPFTNACDQARRELLNANVDLTTPSGARIFREILRPFFTPIT